MMEQSKSWCFRKLSTTLHSSESRAFDSKWYLCEGICPTNVIASNTSDMGNILPHTHVHGNRRAGLLAAMCDRHQEKNDCNIQISPYPDPLLILAMRQSTELWGASWTGSPSAAHCNWISLAMPALMNKISDFRISSKGYLVVPTEVHPTTW